MSEYLDLHALADGQLEGEEKAAVTALKDTLASKCESITCEETWKKCQGRLKEIEKARGVEHFVGKYAWGLCGAFLLAIVVGGSINRGTAGVVRTGDVARVSASMSPLQLPSSQAPEERKRWFQDVMSGPMVDTPESIQIVGAASGVINSHRVVRLSLVDTSGSLALFILQNTEGIEDAQARGAGYSACQMNGANGVAWTEGPHSYMLVGRRTHDDLAAIATAIRGK
jgi:hypothetical protein